MACRIEDLDMNPNYPLFTPAASSSYVRHCSKSATVSSDESNWYKHPRTKTSHPAILYSAGHAHLNIKRSRIEEAMIMQRDRSKTLFLSDSGGFTIGTNSLPGGECFRLDIHGRVADSMRMDNMIWQEAFSDYGMTLDFPAWAVGTPNYLFQSVEQCLKETVYNLDFIKANMVSGRIKWLNVVQGKNYEQAKKWYNKVKTYPFNGWALAGPVAADPDITVKILMNMWRDGTINPENNWVHVLGRSSLNAVWANNIIHRCIRDFICPNAQISYDSSSNVQYAVNGIAVVGARINADELAFTTDSMPVEKRNAAELCRVFNSNLYTMLEHIERVNSLSTLSIRDLINERPVPNVNIRFKQEVLRVFERAASIGIGRFPIDDVDLTEFSNVVG